jgi:hypothetical protein
MLCHNWRTVGSIVIIFYIGLRSLLSHPACFMFSVRQHQKLTFINWKSIAIIIKWLCHNCRDVCKLIACVCVAVEDYSLQCCVLWLCVTTNFSCRVEIRGQSDDRVLEGKRSCPWSGCPPLRLQYCVDASPAPVPTWSHHTHCAAPSHKRRVSIC